MAKRANTKRDKAKRELAGWYKLKPAVWALPLLFFIGLWVPPLARGDSFQWATLKAAVWATALAVMLGLMIGWLAWRCSFRSNGVANLVFSLTVVGCGVWSIALSAGQRENAQVDVVTAIDSQVVKVKEQVLTAID